MTTSSSISINPATGERMRWHVRSADSGGRLARLEMWCAPGGGVPFFGVHPHSEERFELLAGRLTVEIGPDRLAAGPGDQVTIPAGAPHRWNVEGDEEAHFFVELDDPRDFEEGLEAIFALGRNGRLGAGGRLPLLIAAPLALPFLDSGHLARPSVRVQRVLFRLLDGVARLTGHRRAVEAARAEARAIMAGASARVAVAA